MKRKKINGPLYEETRKHLLAIGENPDEKAEITRLGLYYYLSDALAENGVHLEFVGKNENPIAEALFMVLMKKVINQVLGYVFDKDEENGGGGHRNPFYGQRRVTGLCKPR